ncbi:GIP, partial [Symbiodinium sp. CCMP2456]
MDVVEPEGLDLLPPVAAVVPAEEEIPPERRLRTKSKGVEEIPDRDLEDLFDIDKREVIEAPPAMSRMVTEPEKLHPAEAHALKILTNLSTEAVQPNQIHHLLNLLPDERFPRGEVPPGEEHENHAKSRAKEKKAWSTGAFIHGGVAGLRRSTRSFPTTTKVINAYIKQVDPNHQWTSVAILKNHQTAMHKDPHNSLYHQTLLAPLTKFRRGGLWVPGPEEGYAVIPRQVQGRKVDGHVLQVSRGPIKFYPRDWHEVSGWSGTRVVLAAYTIRSDERINGSDREFANELGFQLPDLEGGSADDEQPPLPPPEHPPPALRPIRVVRDMLIKSAHISAIRLAGLRLDWENFDDVKRSMIEAVHVRDFANKIWMERYNIRSAVRMGCEAGLEEPFVHPTTGENTMREYCTVVDCGHSRDRFYWYFTYRSDDFVGERNIVIFGAEVERQYVITDDEMRQDNWNYTRGNPHMGRRTESYLALNQSGGPGLGHETWMSDGDPLEEIPSTVQEEIPSTTGPYFEEIDEEVLLRMAQVEITNEWFEEQAESSSSTARLHKTEVTYTKGIEDLLEQLESEGKDLEVTHNVDVAEVKKHLDRWRPSAEKEFYNLRDTKEAFCVTTKDQLPPGTLI